MCELRFQRFEVDDYETTKGFSIKRKSRWGSARIKEKVVSSGLMHILTLEGGKHQMKHHIV